METPGARFDSWAVVELFGHTKEVGYVTTQYFGGAAMFQIDVPELPEREVTLREPQYIANTWTPAGAVVKKAALPARSRLVGPSAVYSMTPCSEDTARRMLDQGTRCVAVVSLPDTKQLLPGEPDDSELDEELEG